MAGKIVRVLRVVEYEGPEDWVLHQVQHAIHGLRVFGPKQDRNIRGATVPPGSLPPTVEVELWKMLDSGPVTRAYPGEYAELGTAPTRPDTPQEDSRAGSQPTD